MMKAVAIIYAKCCGRLHGGKESFFGVPSSSRLGQGSYREEVNFTRASKSQ